MLSPFLSEASGGQHRPALIIHSHSRVRKFSPQPASAQSHLAAIGRSLPAAMGSKRPIAAHRMRQKTAKSSLYDPRYTLRRSQRCQSSKVWGSIWSKSLFTYHFAGKQFFQNVLWIDNASLTSRYCIGKLPRNKVTDERRTHYFRPSRGR